MGLVDILVMNLIMIVVNIFILKILKTNKVSASYVNTGVRTGPKMKS